MIKETGLAGQGIAPGVRGLCADSDALGLLADFSMPRQKKGPGLPGPRIPISQEEKILGRSRQKSRAIMLQRTNPNTVYSPSTCTRCEGFLEPNEKIRKIKDINRFEVVAVIRPLPRPHQFIAQIARLGCGCTKREPIFLPVIGGPGERGRAERDYRPCRPVEA